MRQEGGVATTRVGLWGQCFPGCCCSPPPSLPAPTAGLCCISSLQPGVPVPPHTAAAVCHRAWALVPVLTLLLIGLYVEVEEGENKPGLWQYQEDSGYFRLSVGLTVLWGPRAASVPLSYTSDMYICPFVHRQRVDIPSLKHLEFSASFLLLVLFPFSDLSCKASCYSFPTLFCCCFILKRRDRFQALICVVL